MESPCGEAPPLDQASRIRHHTRMAETETFGAAIVGCGTVGCAAASLLLSQHRRFSALTGTNLHLKALVAVNFSRARKAGLDESLFNDDLAAVLADPEIRVVVETVGGLTAARTIIEKALKAGKHVVTANKALLAHYGAPLFALARKNNRSIGFEAACAGGIPIIRSIIDGLAANRTDALYGIVNGTSNFILTEMVQQGRTYPQALKEAQDRGLAEADPTLDVNGTDAAHKLSLLGSLAFGEQIPFSAIPVQGIDGLNLFDLSTGAELGYILKLIALAKRTPSGLESAVKPVFLPRSHPLSRVSGPFNAVSIYGDAVGHTMYCGRGAGGSPTASAVVSDIISIALGTWPILFAELPIWPDRCPQARLAPPGESLHRRYLRFNIRDESGAVAHITDILASRNISLNSFIQKESPQESSLVPVVITTHECTENAVLQAFTAISELPAVGPESACIPIIDEHPESV